MKVPYHTEDEFVRGQKIKLALAIIILLIVAIRAWLTGEPFLQ